MDDKKLRVGTIRDGTVIDHITAGSALKVVRILGIDEGTEDIVSIAMNVPSNRTGTKDIVKVEGRELASDEVDKIALIAPKGTINIIRDYEVIEKNKVHLPRQIEGVVRCPNRNCISNTEEPINSEFQVVTTNPVKLRCVYCERVLDQYISEHIK
ncbi:aspartate carbamoyltransferase regulatory subunit [Methanonatronarchaeum sp. AMET-Sl]|uniref:aspartate carbamoyltransferase regulatory subunit n=1 Tax=Methanonatronarchaeum sp. AMET-Sl TaxID=3037654 RepID=UPI00244DC5AB|nr:aspartate carbamoyltransferase regulatory subunit [Methanonatronarchaeum sp. AMET-Sl]WGI17928.1 aspartate carbamoyltransferase regulatory subunit [Methanonatronarchaeum sp. AMET-Sl]